MQHDKTIHDNIRYDKIGQNMARQDKTIRQPKTIRNMQDNSIQKRQYTTRQDNTILDKIRQ